MYVYSGYRLETLKRMHDAWCVKRCDSAHEDVDQRTCTWACIMRSASCDHAIMQSIMHYSNSNHECFNLNKFYNFKITLIMARLNNLNLGSSVRLFQNTQVQYWMEYKFMRRRGIIELYSLLFVNKSTVTQGCNPGMRPNAAKCGYNPKIKSYISNRANREKDVIYL